MFSKNKIISSFKNLLKFKREKAGSNWDFQSLGQLSPIRRLLFSISNRLERQWNEITKSQIVKHNGGSPCCLLSVWAFEHLSIWTFERSNILNVRHCTRDKQIPISVDTLLQCSKLVLFQPNRLAPVTGLIALILLPVDAVTSAGSLSLSLRMVWQDKTVQIGKPTKACRASRSSHRRAHAEEPHAEELA